MDVHGIGEGRRVPRIDGILVNEGVKGKKYKKCYYIKTKQKIRETGLSNHKNHKSTWHQDITPLSNEYSMSHCGDG